MTKNNDNQAIILAAGVSKRLGPLTLTNPKCLLRLGGRRILDYQLSLLESCGIEDITMITGYREHQIQKAVGDRARCIFYPDFRTTNNLYTLRYCRHLLDRPTVIMFSDVLIGSAGFSRLFDSRGDFVLLVDTGQSLPGTMRVKVEGNTLKGIGQDVSTGDCDGNFIGILKTSNHGAELLSEELETMYSQNRFTNDYYTRALPGLAARDANCEIRSVADVPWFEIDTVADYLAARKKIKTMDLP